MNSTRHQRPGWLSAAPVASTWLARGLMVCALAGQSVLALLLVLRSGTLVRSLPTATLLLVSVCLCMVTVLLISNWRAAWETAAHSHSVALQWGVLILATVSMLIVGGALSSNGLSQTSATALWLPILIATLLLGRWAWRVGQPIAPRAEAFRALMPKPTRSTAQRPVTGLKPTPLAPTTSDPNTHVTQQLTRGDGQSGTDIATGRLLIQLLPGQRTATAHVAFCPPFAGLPRIEAHAESASGAKVKVVQAFAHGAKLELKLAAPALRQTEEWLAFTAAVSAPSLPAAGGTESARDLFG